MDAKELRIGNLLKQKDDSIDCNGFCSVLTLDKDGLRTDFTRIKHGSEVTTISYYQFNSELINECIKPIPLTEEWLLKFGYRLSQGHYIILGHIIWKCNDLLVCNKNGITLKHVHQLQNLYFALTNKELTI